MRKRITLMALFSGAGFVIMAGIIRAVTILKVSPPVHQGFSDHRCNILDLTLPL